MHRKILAMLLASLAVGVEAAPQDGPRRVALLDEQQSGNVVRFNIPEETGSPGGRGPAQQWFGDNQRPRARSSYVKTSLDERVAAEPQKNASSAPVPGSLSDWLGAMQALTQQALLSHPTLRQGRAAQQAADTDISTAKWQMAPTPSLSRDYAGQAYKDHYQNVARLQQPLWTGGQITAGIEQAEARLQSTKHALGDQEREIILRVAQSWGDWVRAQQRQRAQSALLKAHEDLYAMITRRVKQGVAAISDEDLARSRLQSVRGDMLREEVNVRQALATLENLIGGPVPAKAEQALLGPAPFQITREELVAAMLNAPAVARSLADENVAKADLESKKAVLQPQVYARAERLWGAVDDTRAYIAVQTAFGAGAGSFSSIDAQQQRLNAAKGATDAVRKNAIDQAHLEYSRYESARIRQQTAKATVLDSKAVLESYQVQFVAGKRGWLDVLNMVREAHQADMEQIDADVDVRLSLLRIAVLTHGLLTNAVAE